MNMASLANYELIREEVLQDLNSQGTLLRHKKSGARVFLISNDDDNKVFTIGFRTPPANSTGVAHIMEHSVLCGSRKFPLKDPFVELAKGSLNTFLNAMTYSDKTLYPVASCNDTDFQNLMDVYMDATLHPRIYETDKIFRQEGWHYEMESAEAPLTINGVVYNEMKGAFSDPMSVLDRSLQASLYPDTAYGQESGGDPEVIPELSYEEFLDFHRRYYHPSNSYIFLYGNMDMEEKLNWLDQAYLKEYDAIDPDSELGIQKAFTEPKRLSIPYGVEEGSDDGAFLAFGVTVGDLMDPVRYLAWNVIDYALLQAPGAPLREALINKKLCKDVSGGTDNGIAQPYFTLIAKQADENRMDEFLETIEAVLKEQVEKGLNQRTIAACLNSMEFRIREADFGSYPKGLVYGLQCFDSWLYDEKEPFMHLSFDECFKCLRAHMEDGFYEKLIAESLLDNPHQIQMVMYPEVGLSGKKEAALAKKLAAKKAAMSEAEILAMVEGTKELKAYQEAEDAPEVVATIPLLSREDIRKEVNPYHNELRHEAGGDIMFHEIFTSGITYLDIFFDLNGFTAEELQYAALLRTLFCYVNTKNYTYGELSDELGIHTGGLGTAITSFDSIHDTNDFLGVYSVGTKVTSDKLSFAFRMFKEILLTTDLRSRKRIQDLIAQNSNRYQQRMPNSGHSTAIGRAIASFSRSAKYSDLTSGLGFGRFIVDLDRHFEERAEEIMDKLEAVRTKIFKPSRMFVSITGDADAYGLLPEELEAFAAELKDAFGDEGAPSSQFNKGNCDYQLDEAVPLKPQGKYGLTTSGQVQYVAKCGNYKDAGLAFDPALRVLSVIMNYDYLWLNLRVKGGAYGCMSNFSRCGESYLVSYRDPNLSETLKVYEGIPEYLRSFEADEREMTKYIIGTFSDMDTPKTPKMMGNISMSAYFSGMTMELAQEARNRLLSIQSEDIRGLAPYVEAVLQGSTVCVVGSENKIEEEKALFDVTEPLFPKA